MYNKNALSKDRERGGKSKKNQPVKKTALCTKNQQEKSSRKSRLTENGSTCNKEINTWIIFFGNKIPVLVMNTLQKLGGRQTGDHGWWRPDTHQPSEGGDKMGGNSFVHQIKFWITRIILASLLDFSCKCIHNSWNFKWNYENVCIWNERETTLACWLFGLRNLYVSYRSSESWRISISLVFILNNLWIVRKGKKCWCLYLVVWH